MDGACRPRTCLEMDCDTSEVCQPGPFCVSESDAEDPICDVVVCEAGFVCQRGPFCRPGGEDLDLDGSISLYDCDDANALRFPGNPEICDGVDNNCNGLNDDDAPCREEQRCCGTAGCIDTSTDREHCGACGQTCATYDECEDGRCVGAPDPFIESVTPDPLLTGQWLGRDGANPLLINGEHLVGFATVYISSDDGESEADPFEVVGAPNGRYYFNDQALLIDGADLPGGSATLRIVRNDGRESNHLSIVVEGAAAPIVTGVSPNPLRLADDMIVSVYGSNFWGEPAIMISPDVPFFDWRELPLRWIDSDWLRTESVFLDPTTNPSGFWILKVVNPDGLESELYPVDVAPAPEPTLSGVSPTEGMIGDALTLEVFGNDMYGTPTLWLAHQTTPDEPMPSIPLATVDPRRVVTTSFVLDPELYASGPHHLWVTNPDGSSSNRLRFLVLE